MFAEELKGNASRKRAEENKARRQRLKNEQQGKNATRTVTTTSATLGPSTTPAGSLLPGAPNSVMESPASGVTSTITPNTSKAVAGGGTGTLTLRMGSPANITPLASTPQGSSSFSTHVPSALERAEQQRRVRAEAALRQKASILVQSAYRSFISRKKLRAHHQKVLGQRLEDMATLRTILAEKRSMVYIPPPATAKTLIQQLLFITSTTHHISGVAPKTHLLSDQVKLLDQVLQYVLLPGLCDSTDHNMHPISTWMESSEGRLRLERLLRLVLVACTEHTSALMEGAVKFFKALLSPHVASKNSSPSSPSSSSSLAQYIWHLLFPKTTRLLPPPEGAERDIPCASHGTSIDIIAHLRYFLLFFGAGPKPIPPDAPDKREACIPTNTRNYAGSLILLILQSIALHDDVAERKRFYSLVLTHVLTVPLFSWKVSMGALSFLATEPSSVPFVSLIQAFTERNVQTLNTDGITAALPSEDVPLTICPATPSQCLLANLLQIGRLCPMVNGSDRRQLQTSAASLYYDLVTALLDAVPLGTFSSRESAVEWIIVDGHHKAVVMSSVILDQCKSLLVDSQVRKMVQVAIDTEALQTDAVLAAKNDKDRKLEQDLAEEGTAVSASILASKEARIDRSVGFWNSSKWARNLTKGVANLLASGNSDNASKGAPKEKGHGELLDSTAVSRALAEGRGFKKEVGTNKSPEKKREPYSTNLLFSLCRTYSVVLARWGGWGRNDLEDTPRGKGFSAVASATQEPCTVALLNVLCFASPIVRVSWGLAQSNQDIVSDVYAVIEPDVGKVPVKALGVRPTFSATLEQNRPRQANDGAILLFIFTCALSHTLIITDDVELHDFERPIALHQIRRSIQVLKKLLYRACVTDDVSSSHSSTYFGHALVAAAARTMRDLYDRSSRRPLCVPKLWTVSDLMEPEIRKCKTHSDYVALLALPVFQVCPFLVSFKRRLKLFEKIVTTSRIEIQGVNDANPFNSNPLKPGIPVRITRGRILEDGLLTMNNLGRNMRQRISVHYVNEAGVEEIGVDAGGLFKEFWTDLSAVAFDPNYALFRVSEGAGNCLYPNPSSGSAHGSDHIVLFEFLGRILGKALFEGITIHPRFAHFFLSFLRGDYNFLHTLPDLSTVDPQLYNNLMFLKTYEGDAADLCLTFTITNDDFGGTKEVPLIPNGANVEVTNENKHRYIGLVAKYYVVDRVKEQSIAFTRGLWEVIDQSWLRLFNEPELQVLVSGVSDGKIDIDDLRANTRYAGGFTALDRTVNRFWKVVANLEGHQQASLLRFVTSCERPPPLGFASLNPPFTIQRVGILRDGEKLPTASTCFNILKLPTYSSEKVLRERLLYALESGAGFELT